MDGADFPRVVCNPASRFTSRSPSFEDKFLRFGQFGHGCSQVQHNVSTKPGRVGLNATVVRSASGLTACCLSLLGYSWTTLVRFVSRAL